MSAIAGLDPTVHGRAVRLSFDQPDSSDAGAAAGVYTATVDVPAYALITDVGMHAVALWNAGTSAVAIVGDDDDPDGFFGTGVSVKSTDLAAGQSINMQREGGEGGAYYAGTGTHWTNRYSATDRTITFQITTVGTAPTTGETICWVNWLKVPSNAPKGALPYGSYVAS